MWSIGAGFERFPLSTFVCEGGVRRLSVAAGNSWSIYLNYTRQKDREGETCLCHSSF